MVINTHMTIIMSWRLATRVLLLYPCHVQVEKNFIVQSQPFWQKITDHTHIMDSVWFNALVM